MTDVLVVNHNLSDVCGVHDLGWRLYDAIPDHTSKAYAQAWDATSLLEAVSTHEPGVVLVNYRPDLMPWMAGVMSSVTATTVAVAHNYDPGTLPALHMRHRSDGFDFTLALEPCLFDFDGVVWSGRPMPPPIRVVVDNNGVPFVGSFGFAFGHKRFDLVAREVASLGRQASFRLRCPTAHFGGSQAQTDAVIRSVHEALEGSQAVASIATDHVPWFDVVNELAHNDVNALLYDPGQPDAGLSSALDYLLAAGRPILVSQASMFRHALPAAVTWPDHTLADVLDNADRLAVNVRERYDQLTAGYAAGISELLERA